LSRDTGCRAKHLVVFAERPSVVFLSQVEIAEHLIPDAHRHAEESPHRRVVRGKSHRGGVAPNVFQPNGFGLVDEYAQYAAALWQMTDQLTGFLVDSFVDELDQLVTLSAHAQRPESRVDEFDRRMNDRAQGGIEVEVGRYDEHGVDEPVEPVPALHYLPDPVLDLGEQFAQAQVRQRVAQRTGAAFLTSSRSVGHGIIVALGTRWARIPHN
jgi:hypothetical protein